MFISAPMLKVLMDNRLELIGERLHAVQLLNIIITLLDFYYSILFWGWMTRCVGYEALLLTFVNISRMFSRHINLSAI